MIHWKDLWYPLQSLNYLLPERLYDEIPLTSNYCLKIEFLFFIHDQRLI